MQKQNYVVLFADIVNSMGLYDQLGDEGAKSLILELQQQQAAVIAAANGTVQEFIGDEVMARFDQCEYAAIAASRLHELSLEISDRNNIKVAQRIGFHYGPAIVDADRMFGDTVNVASRVAAIAKSAQTIATEAAVEQLSPARRATVRHYDITKIKGKYGLLDIYELNWQASGQTTLMRTRDESSSGKLTIEFEDTKVVLDTRSETLHIGRAVTNNLIVHGKSVSREHVSIEVMRNRFVVADNSTNGTYVYFPNGEDIYLRREQIPIWGQGRIALGAPHDVGDHHVLNFKHLRR